jgi:hypothetical protein
LIFKYIFSSSAGWAYASSCDAQKIKSEALQLLLSDRYPYPRCVFYLIKKHFFLDLSYSFLNTNFNRLSSISFAFNICSFTPPFSHEWNITTIKKEETRKPAIHISDWNFEQKPQIVGSISANPKQPGPITTSIIEVASEGERL